MKENYYDILGVDKKASEGEIKKAYRALSKKHHPDINNGEDEMFKKIVSAYEVLSDKTQRSNYDLYGDPKGKPQGGFGMGNMDDILRQFKGAFGSRHNAVYYQGEHITMSVNLTLEEIQKGIDKELVYKKDCRCTSCKGNGSKNGVNLTNCSMCGGAGRIQVVIQSMGVTTIQPCGHCGGKGKIPTIKCSDCYGGGLIEKETKIGVHFPAGVYGGWGSPLKGHGHESEMENSIPGNLYVVVEELAHPRFKRDGDNIIYNLKLSFPDLILGKSVVIPTLEKSVTFDVPPYSNADSVFKIKGRGLSSMQYKGVFGDLLVEVEIDVPKAITDEEKKILQELQKSSNFTV